MFDPHLPPPQAGPLLGQLFRQLFRKLAKDVQRYCQKAIDKGSDFSPVAAVHHKTISNGLKYALATGNWGAQKSAPGSIRAGVSQVLDGPRIDGPGIDGLRIAGHRMDGRRIDGPRT
jgi:DNA-directed RNA polymerase beta subunit